MESDDLGECSTTVVENHMCIQNCTKAGVRFIPSLLEANDTPETLRQNQIFSQQVASVLYLFLQQKSHKNMALPLCEPELLEPWAVGDSPVWFLSW